MSSDFWRDFDQSEHILTARSRISSLVWMVGADRTLVGAVTSDDIQALIDANGSTFDTDEYEDSAVGRAHFAIHQGIIKLMPANEAELRQVIESLSEDLEELTETVAALTARLEAVEGE